MQIYKFANKTVIRSFITPVSISYVVWALLYFSHGVEWNRHRVLVDEPLNKSLSLHLHGLFDVCESLTQKIYNARNHHDEVTKDLYHELHKWSFDCMG